MNALYVCLISKLAFKNVFSFDRHTTNEIIQDILHKKKNAIDVNLLFAIYSIFYMKEN